MGVQWVYFLNKYPLAIKIQRQGLESQPKPKPGQGKLPQASTKPVPVLQLKMREIGVPVATPSEFIHVRLEVRHDLIFGSTHRSIWNKREPAKYKNFEMTTVGKGKQREDQGGEQEGAGTSKKRRKRN